MNNSKAVSENSLITTDSIFLDIESVSQEDVFLKIADAAKKQGLIKKEKKLVKSFFSREKESSTGFGDGFAIPHARTRGIKKPGIFFVRSKNDIEWKALDDQPVKIIIALLVPLDKAADIHLEMLSKVAQKLLKPEIQKKLINTTDKQEIIEELIN